MAVMCFLRKRFLHKRIPVSAGLKHARSGIRLGMTDERKDKDSIPHAGGLTESQKKDKAAKENAKAAADNAAHAGDNSPDPHT